ncbi:MAG: aminotransferase class V-fold PLP-dependent enzyme, partial [Acidimicrobiia bacterium]|nr:aminotransferase class V-fold PLP-dependent enzyme [Acidimicrobiia bacterium]
MLRSHWRLDPEITFLNHGSFGATPTTVLDRQEALRDQMEAEPVRFFERDLETMWDTAQQALADFVGADVDDIAFVTNATAGVNAVLRSLTFEPGSEIIVTDHGYEACRNAVEYVAKRSSATVVVVPIPFPPADQASVTDAIADAVTPRTVLALVDHVTSPTGLVFPVGDIVAALEHRGVDVLVDGAHAPGMLDLDIDAIGAAYYTGNCHKWMCAPKGVGFLHVRRDRQSAVVPTVISHGAS